MSIVSQPYWICAHCLNNQGHAAPFGLCVMCGHPVDYYDYTQAFAKVKIRNIEGVQIKENALQLEGKWFWLKRGKRMDETETSLYIGERKYYPCDTRWPGDAPSWIAEGDLEFYDPYKYLIKLKDWHERTN